MYWFKYETWDYMDEVPSFGYQMFDSEATAKEWAEHLTENYSGGPTRIIGPATQKEIATYIERYDIEVSEELYNNIHNPNNYLK